MDEKKISQNALAKAGGITPKTLGTYLSLATLPNVKTLTNWTINLGINANWLLTGEGPMFMADLGKTTDPMILRLRETDKLLRAAGASNEVLQQGLLAVINAPLEPQEPIPPTKPTDARYPTAVREDAAPKTQEPLRGE